MENQAKTKRWTKEEKIVYLEQEIQRSSIEIDKVKVEIDGLNGKKDLESASNRARKTAAVTIGNAYVEGLKKRLLLEKTI